jgi:hypothetical protein
MHPRRDIPLARNRDSSYTIYMRKRASNSTIRPPAPVLGADAFAAIAAVEGLRLKGASRKRIAALRGSTLSPEERRAAVLRAYSDSKVRR